MEAGRIPLVGRVSAVGHSLSAGAQNPVLGVAMAAGTNVFRIHFNQLT